VRGQEWAPFTLRYRYGETTYHIRVLAAENGEAGLLVDGAEQEAPAITLVDDGREHEVEVRVSLADLAPLTP
jgi:cyclic beta-1,2-glucan synthetase